MNINQDDFQSLLDQLDISVFILSGDLNENPEVVYNNAAFAQWVSATSEEILGQSLAFLFPPQDRTDVAEAVKAICDDGANQIVSLSLEGLDSQHRRLHFMVKPFKQNAGKVTACLFQEIKTPAQTPPQDYEDEPGSLAWKLAQKDEDTGVFNRRYLFEQMERECLRLYRYGSVYTLIGVELLAEDEEKSDADTLDNWFHAASELLQEAFRSQDIIGRHQPDQFVVLMPETKLSQALYVAERLKRDFNDRHAEGNGPKVAIGVTEGKVTDQHFADTLARVEQSLEESRISQGLKVACSM